jgi:hypothetical protein
VLRAWLPLSHNFVHEFTSCVEWYSMRQVTIRVQDSNNKVNLNDFFCTSFGRNGILDKKSQIHQLPVVRALTEASFKRVQNHRTLLVQQYWMMLSCCTMLNENFKPSQTRSNIVLNWREADTSAWELAVTRPWLRLHVLNAFPTLSCILFKLKHSWNTHQTFCLLL